MPTRWACGGLPAVKNSPPAWRVTDGNPLCGVHETRSSRASCASSAARATRTSIGTFATAMPPSCRTAAAAYPPPRRVRRPGRGRWPAVPGRRCRRRCRAVGAGWHDRAMANPAARTARIRRQLLARTGRRPAAVRSARDRAEAGGRAAAGHPGPGPAWGPAGDPGRAAPGVTAADVNQALTVRPHTGDRLAEPGHAAPGAQRGLLATASAHHSTAGHRLLPAARARKASLPDQADRGVAGRSSDALERGRTADPGAARRSGSDTAGLRTSGRRWCSCSSWRAARRLGARAR